MTGVLFDLDGTLLDTLEDLADSTNAALSHFSYPSRTLEQVRQFVGNGAARLIRLAVPEGEDPAPVLAFFSYVLRLAFRNVLFYEFPAGFLPLRSFF